MPRPGFYEDTPKNFMSQFKMDGLLLSFNHEVVTNIDLPWDKMYAEVQCDYDYRDTKKERPYVRIGLWSILTPGSLHKKTRSSPDILILTAPWFDSFTHMSYRLSYLDHDHVRPFRNAVMKARLS